MEFWGVEVKPGQSLKVLCDSERVIHISQASLGEIKDDKGAKNVTLRLKIGEKCFILGSLSAEERPQISSDLIFDKPFELSHDLKNGSVYFLGYYVIDDQSDSDGYSGTSDEDLPIPITAPENETPELKVDDVKQEKTALKKPSEPSKEEPVSDENDDSADGEDDSADDEEDDGDSEDSDEVMEGDNSSDDQEEASDDDESDEEPQEKPKEKLKKKQSEPIVSPPKKAKTAAANKPVPKKVTPPAAKPKKSPQPMKNSSKSQKKPSQKKH